MATLSVISKKLNIYTPQNIAVSQGRVIVPLLDGQLLRITPTGESSTIANLMQSELGVPFGMTVQENDVIVTTSDFLPQHYLLRVKPDGKVEPIANLTQQSGSYGAPFGVVVFRGDYFVTISTDVVESTSELIRVSPKGEIRTIANLTEFKNPFGLVVQEDSIVIAQSSGHLVRVKDGEVSAIVDLQESGFGLPFNVATWRDQIVATTNAGLVVTVDKAGNVSTVADLNPAKYQIPSGIVAFEKDLIVTTNGGFLLRISV
ncbi:MAG: hypothetical protein MUC48_18300 [Leptolyngbya sp. Prado105]|nr:hypothetical protein [Leptolyngbya sp. Prado105]